MRATVRFLLTLIITLSGLATANAQGIVWSLPDDTSFVRFEGDYKETVYRPQNNDGDLILSWRRILFIRSVGAETAEYNGEFTPCRWLEFEMQTGKEVAGKIQPGPGGYLVIKALVPEKAITDKTKDADGIPMEFLPMVKGFRKIDDRPVEELPAGVLQLYPTLTLLRNYTSLESGGAEDVTMAGQTIATEKFQGEMVIENPTTRSTHHATIWKADGVPFGLTKWTVKIEHEKKDSTADRADFRPSVEISMTMEATEKGTNDQSKLATP
jgi:hypothetical protein